MTSTSIYPRDLKTTILSINYTRLTSRTGKLSKPGQFICDTIKSYGYDVNRYPLKEFVYHILQDLPSRPTCPECNNEISKYSVYSGKIVYQKFCNQQCYHKNETARQLISDIKTSMYNNPNIKQLIEYKKIKTNIQNTGFAHPMQNPISFEKQMKSSFVNNIQVVDGMRLIGYEPQVYRYLSMIYSDVIQGTLFLKTNNVKIVWMGDDEKYHHSMPDFFIKDINSFVEVKSEYTRNKDDYKIMKAKSACLKLGFGYIIITFIPTRRFGKMTIETFG